MTALKEAISSTSNILLGILPKLRKVIIHHSMKQNLIFFLQFENRVFLRLMVFYSWFINFRKMINTLFENSKLLTLYSYANKFLRWVKLVVVKLAKLLEIRLRWSQPCTIVSTQFRIPAFANNSRFQYITNKRWNYK